MSNEQIVKLKRAYVLKKADYEVIDNSQLNQLCLIEKVKVLKELDNIIAELYELELFGDNEYEDGSDLVKEYQWLSRQYEIVSIQLVGKHAHEKKEVYQADGIDDEQMKLIKRLWPENKYPHGPEFPDLIFKVRADYLISLASYLVMKNRQEKVS